MSPACQSSTCQSSCICWVFIAHGCFFLPRLSVNHLAVSPARAGTSTEGMDRSRAAARAARHCRASLAGQVARVPVSARARPRPPAPGPRPQGKWALSEASAAAPPPGPARARTEEVARAPSPGTPCSRTRPGHSRRPRPGSRTPGLRSEPSTWFLLGQRAEVGAGLQVHLLFARSYINLAL